MGMYAASMIVWAVTLGIGAAWADASRGKMSAYATGVVIGYVLRVMWSIGDPF